MHGALTPEIRAELLRVLTVYDGLNYAVAVGELRERGKYDLANTLEEGVITERTPKSGKSERYIGLFPQGSDDASMMDAVGRAARAAQVGS